MAFLEERISAKITENSQGGPTQPSRRRVYTAGGKLKQNFSALMPIHRYEVSHGVRSQADYQTVLDLFYIVMFTPYEGFRFKDWGDYQLTQANSRLTLVSGSDYQINRVHTFGAVEFLRPIYKPVDGTIVVKRNRSSVISTATATVTATTGVAAISDHVSGDTYTCEGEFDVPVTFSSDEWTASWAVHINNLHMISGTIPLEEIRL
jgi:uncharacterized protein (TIGR02217 family)